MKTRAIRFGLVLSLFMMAASLGPLQAQTAPVRAKVSEALPHYQASVPVKGNVEIPCTDALTDLGGEWNRGFRKFQPSGNLVFLPKLRLAAKRLN